MVIPALYVSCGQFSEGLAIVKLPQSSSKGGLPRVSVGLPQVIDKSGQPIAADLGRYDDIGDFHDGLALVLEGGTLDDLGLLGHALWVGYIDKSGKVVWEPTK
jgi:hypothetical protein